MIQLPKLTSKYISGTKNVLARYRNLLVSMIKEQPRLPKLLVNVMDNDLIKNLPDEIWEDSRALNRVVTTLMNGQSKLILTQKEFLAQKSKKTTYPHIIWIEAPVHDNFPDNDTRQLFNRSLNEAAKFQQDVTVLKLKEDLGPNRSQFIH